MNSNRQFDEYIKDQLGNYTPEVHPRVWENIIAEKDRKRPAGFWVSMLNNRNKLLLLGLIIALSSGGAWLMYKNPFTVNNSTSEKTERKKITGKPDITSVNNPAEELPFSNTVPANMAPGQDEMALGPNPVLSVSGKTKTSISSPTPETVELDAPKVRPNTFYTGLGNVLVNTTAPALQEDEYPETGGTLLGRLTYNAEKYTEKRISGKKKPEPNLPAIAFLPDCPGIEKDAAGNKKYFEMYAGPDYAFRSLHDTANSAYLQKRKESTKFKSGFSAGIRYTRVFNNSMSVRGGVNYSQINEKFSLKQGNIVQVIYIINNNGDTIGSYTTTGSRHKTTINRYRSIDIPLMIGYELGNGKLHANINAGPVINIYSWQKGDVLDASGNPVSITTGKSSSPYAFKTNAGVGFMGAVSVYYKLNDRLHLMAEPYFRYNLSSMNKESITLKQKYHTAGLRLGIRLDLK